MLSIIVYLNKNNEYKTTIDVEIDKNQQLMLTNSNYSIIMLFGRGSVQIFLFMEDINNEI